MRKAKRWNMFAVLLALVLSVTTCFNVDNTAQAAAKKYVKSLKISNSTMKVTAGKKGKRNVTVKTKGKLNKSVTVKSSNKAIATVKVGTANKKGVSTITVTGKSAGTAKITVTTKSKNKNKKKLKKTFKVNVSGGSTTPQTANSSTNSNNTPNTTEEPNTANPPAKVEVANVRFAVSTVEMTVGDIKTTVATIEPSNANNTTITYSSSDISQSVIKVDAKTGTVTAVGAGTAVVTATANNGVKATYTVVVNEPQIAVDKVSVTSNSEHYYANSDVQLSATVEPENATYESIIWKSNNTDGAIVDKNGLVSCLRAGETVTITATAGEVTGKITFTVEAEPVKEVAVTSVAASVSDMDKNDAGVYTIKEGATAQITTVIEPADATYKEIRYSVKDDSKLLTVSETGLVTANSEGNATIVVTVGDKTAEVSFNIVPNEYSVSLDKTDTQILSLKSGYNTNTLTATVVPSTEIVTWSSSNAGVVDIEQTSTNTVTVTAVAAGQTTITATVGNKKASVDYIITENDYVIFTKANGMAEGNYEFTVAASYKFSNDSVTAAALKNSTILLTYGSDTSKVYTATFKSINGDSATYSVNPTDFVISGHYGEMNGVYKLSHGIGDYLIDADDGLSVTYTEKKYANRIAGRVVDSDSKEALAGVNVKTGAGFSTVTDENGYYDVPSTNGDKVSVSYSMNGYFDTSSSIMVGTQRTSVKNIEMASYDPTKLVLTGTIKATDYESNDAFENDFKVDLQVKNNDGEYDTIATIYTTTLEGTTKADTLTYKFGNSNATGLRDLYGNELPNCNILPEELSINSSSTYRVVITNGVGENKFNPIYTRTERTVTTSTTKREFSADMAAMKQVTPLAGLKIAKNTFSFDEKANDIPDNNNSDLTFTSIKLYATDGTQNADTLLLEASDVTVKTETATVGIRTNAKEIDLREIFGSVQAPVELELPATSAANNIHYYVVFEQKNNAYTVVEVPVEAAGSDITIDNIDSFQKGWSGDSSAGYKLNVAYKATTESIHAIDRTTNLIYAIDNNFNKIMDSHLMVHFNIYQVMNGVNVFLGSTGSTDLVLDSSNAISANNTFDKLATTNEYIAVPQNDYLSDSVIAIAPGETNINVSSDAVANIGSVNVTLKSTSNLPDNGQVFVNSIKLVSGADTNNVIATKAINDNVEIIDGELAVDVSDKFAKIPAGDYKIIYDISGYETVTSDTITLYGFEQTDVSVKDSFTALSKTGVKASVLCDNQAISSPLYALLINSDGVISAASSFRDGSFSMIDGQNGNDISAGSYTLVIRGPGYNTFVQRKTLNAGVTTLLDDIVLEEGARGTIQLYATCNGQSIYSFDGKDITKRTGEMQATVDVTAYDQYYVPASFCATAALRERIAGWDSDYIGAYEMQPSSDGAYYESGNKISKDTNYKVMVTGDFFVTTSFDASLSSNDQGQKVTLENRTVEYNTPEALTKLALTYNVSGNTQLAAGTDYIVLTNEDGTYNGTIAKTWISPSDDKSRTVNIYVPTGFTGKVSVYSSGVTLGSSELDNYNTQSNLTVPLYELSNQ